MFEGNTEFKEKQRDFILWVYNKLHLKLNNKSCVSPTRQVTFLGLIWDDIKGRIDLPDDKVKDLMNIIPRMNINDDFPVKTLLSILGKITHIKCVIQHIQILTRIMSLKLSDALKAADTDYDVWKESSIKIDAELQYAVIMVICEIDRIRRQIDFDIDKKRECYIICDTGETYAGGYLFKTNKPEKLSTYTLSPWEKIQSSGLRELIGLYYFIKDHLDDLMDLHLEYNTIKIHLDNTGAITALLGRSSANPHIRNIIYAIHGLLKETKFPYYFSWLRRSAAGIRLADALSRAPCFKTWNLEFQEFLKEKLGSVPSELFSPSQLHNIHKYEHVCSYGCKCERAIKDRFIDDKFRNKCSLVVSPKCSVKLNSIINFLSSRKMRGALVTPHLYNTSSYQRLKLSKHVSGPFLFKKEFYCQNRSSTPVVDDEAAIFFYEFV